MTNGERVHGLTLLEMHLKRIEMRNAHAPPVEDDHKARWRRKDRARVAAHRRFAARVDVSPKAARRREKIFAQRESLRKLMRKEWFLDQARVRQLRENARQAAKEAQWLREDAEWPDEVLRMELARERREAGIFV